eukprot:scaffold1655_cov247-Pinguiococcus_pyrenoidosus.AAC.9
MSKPREQVVATSGTGTGSLSSSEPRAGLSHFAALLAHHTRQQRSALPSFPPRPSKQEILSGILGRGGAFRPHPGIGGRD